MKIAFVGTGYVGLVAGACFADSGNRVICVDIDEEKIRRLKRGDVPIFEPGLKEIVERNTKAARLTFTTDLADAVRKSRIIFLAVGTPPAEDGSPDLTAILSVSSQIGKAMDDYRIVVMKSTVPVGTHAKVAEAIKAETDHPFDYVSNPEFLKEGAAVEDFTRPDRVVIGATNPAVVEIMRELYGSFLRRDERIYVMDPASAEMTKYAANAMLATRISFMNEIANLCDRFGADIEAVRRGVGSDSRIGTAFLFPGVGYGGSCFPKDIRAMAAMARQHGVESRLIEAVHEVNERQKPIMVGKIEQHFAGDLQDRTIALWGLSFKPRTDDIREAPALVLIDRLLERGAKLQVHDPEAMDNVRAIYGDRLTYMRQPLEALTAAEALVIMTEWAEFRHPNFEAMRRLMNDPVIFDGRNLYEPAQMQQAGFTYHSIGRAPVSAAPVPLSR
ncbi:MAG: UDP-glucose/GDP-mannose dehydrogenase family protein [Planctomycetes bacterium]|nr:UDP-glucose/GDP-mannose dehydrogenase family protein [Planctomycetota bacterium]